MRSSLRINSTSSFDVDHCTVVYGGFYFYLSFFALLLGFNVLAYVHYYLGSIFEIGNN